MKGAEVADPQCNRKREELQGIGNAASTIEANRKRRRRVVPIFTRKSGSTRRAFAPVGFRDQSAFIFYFFFCADKETGGTVRGENPLWEEPPPLVSKFVRAAATKISRLRALLFVCFFFFFFL